MRTPSRLDLLCIALMSTACFSVSGCDDGSTIDGELVLVTPEAPRDLRVLSIRPEEGALTGGTLVVMTGEGFHKDMVVTFGGVEATQLFVGGDSLLALSTPAGASPGAVDVVVNRPALDDVAAQTSTVTAGYTYLPSPADVLVLEVTPSEGPLSAETEVFIVGQSFSEGAKVLFGTKPATNVRVLSSEVIQALAPPGDVRGVVPVRVELVNGASHSLDNAFTYLPDEPVAKLEVLGIIPSKGPLAGGNTVTIEGRGFVEGATVAIGGNSATDVRVLGQAAITATAPAGNGPGLVDVRVEIPESGDNLATTVSVLERAYFYQPEPSSTLAVLAVIPPEGPLAGGTQVAIRGTGFVDGARVFFDGEPCLAVSYLGPDGLVCRTPTATVAGQVDVRVENPAVGQDAGPSAFLTDGYRYLEGPPGLLVLRAIPDTGPTAGGNIVTLEGTGFVAGAQVFFGGAPATGVTVLAETALTATAPSGATAGPVDIRVQLPIPAGGTSGDAYTLSDGYTYQLGGAVGAALTVASLYPPQGDLEGGALVLITGTGFEPAMTIRFGAVQSPLVQVLSASAATALVPAAVEAGFVDVTLLNPDGASASLTQAFRYLDPAVAETGAAPALGGVLPSRGPASGGTLARVFGSNFSPDLRVEIGGTAVSDLVVTSPSLATVRVPPGTTGPASVRVINPDDQDDALAAGFTYTAAPANPPTLTQVWPAMGPATGGTWIVVTGTQLSEGTTVWFGLTPATRTTRVDDTRVIAVAPAAAVGAVALSVVRPDGATATLDDAFAYYGADNLPSTPPVIGGVAPAVGDVAGGQPVELTGSGFQPGARVFFGALEAAVTASPSAARRGVTTPAHAPGATSVTIVNPDGLTHERSNAFVYFTPPPLIQNVSPQNGGLSGGYELSIHGKNFGPQSVVTLGSTTITTFLSALPDRLTFFAPPGLPGPVSVSVTNPDGQLDVEAGAFLYFDDTIADQPTITSVEPPAGPANGGYIALIRGLNFGENASVEFGGIDATDVEWINTNLLKVVVPPGVDGDTVDVAVVNSLSATDTLENAFTYEATAVAPLRIFSVSPGVGPIGGGTVITLDGDGFTEGTLVFVGGVRCPTVNLVSPTTLTAVTPAGAAGLTSVRVERSDASAATAFNAFAYIDPADLDDAPRVVAVEPAVGPLTGNSMVLVTGAGFNGTPRVFFGANEGTAVTVIDPTRLTVRSPARAAPATVAVAVVNPDGLTGVLPGAYSYYDATGATRPEVFIVQPGQGSTFGGQAVNVVGTAFQPGVRAYFCGVPATVTGLSGNNQLAVRTPARTPGACTVTAVNPDGLTGDRAEAFEFVAPAPTLSGIIPSAGPKDGGIDVVIQGNNFVPGASVRFGLALSPLVTVSDENTLTARLPTNNVGVVDVTVINPGAAQASGVLEDAFTYVEDVSGIAPSIGTIFPRSGPLGGGTPVRVIGTGFAPGALLIFDGALLNAATVIDATELRFTTPARAAPGPVSITVLNPDGLGATSAEGFTYAPPSLPAPAIQSVVPATGPEAGGNTITITGQNFRATGTWTLDGRPLTTAATITESLVTVQAPPRAPGKVDLVYIGPDGQVAVRVAAYEYLAAPVLSSVVPGLGPVTGETDVTLVGNFFAPGMQVRFNGVPGQVLVVSSASTATARTPPSIVSGLVEVLVRNPDGQQGRLANGFEYLARPTLASVWPPTGPNPGGSLVQLSGDGFHPQSRVFFGANESATVHYRDRNTLLAFTPEATLSIVDVRVVNPDGQEVTLDDAFTYVAPANLSPAPFISSIFPARGATTGGTRVSIDGTNLSAMGRAFIVPARAAVDFVRNDRAIVIAPSNAVGPTAVYWVNPDGQTVRSPEDFTYLAPDTVGPPPQVASLAPPTGPTGGNTEVTLIGANFQANARVRFGPDDALPVTLGANALTVRSPSRARGAVDVWVVNPDGTQALAPATFRYLAPPTILGVSPVRGPSSGGTVLTIDGADLLEDPMGALPIVQFCDNAALDQGCVSAEPNTVTVSADGRRITVTAPPRPPGVVDVVVVAPDGQLDIAVDAFTVTQLPTVAEIEPSSGPTAGGQTITIEGTGFQAGMTIFIRGTACTNVNVLSGTEVTCRTPAGATGVADVRLLNLDGGSVTQAEAYTYLAPPVLSTIVPNLAPEGEQVETAINGINFSLQATVLFGATPVPSADIISRSSTLIRLRVPLLSGSVDVVVRNPDGQESRKVDGFSYIPPLPPPSALWVLPRTGLIYGGETFRIAGAQFLDGAIVEFGKAPNWVMAPAEQLEVRNNGTLLTGITPQHPAGTVDVRVTNSDGQSDILVDAFEFVRPPDEAPLSVINLEPPRSVMGGGGWLSISGTGFRVNVQVTFVQGGTAVPAPQVQRFGPTLMRAQIPPAPAGVPGDATIIVTNPATFELPQETTVVSDFFEYITGPVYTRHPGDRLPNERSGDLGAHIFDANGDGKNDVLIFNSSADYLLINGFQNSVGWFSERTFAPQGGGFSTRTAYDADFDDDGDIDIVRFNGSQLQFCRNQGGGDFPTCVNIPSGSCSANDFEVGDLNCDGREDFFLGCNSTGQDNVIILNLGDGNFASFTQPLPNNREQTRGASIADVDGDGDNDIILAQGGGANTRLYLNNCADLQLAGECQMAMPNSTTGTAAGRTYSQSNFTATWDVAQSYCRTFGYDGLVRIDDATEHDFVRNATGFTNNAFWIGLHDPQGDKTFQWTQNGQNEHNGWCSGEPNNAADWACAYYEWSSTASARCWRDNPCSSGFRFTCEAARPACSNPWTFANAVYGVTFPFSAGDARDAEFVDINEDGLPDALIAFYGQATRVYMNTGGATQGGQLFLESFERWPLAEANQDFDELIPVDIDNDGDLDIVTRRTNQELRLYTNDRYVVTYRDFGCNPAVADCSCNPCAGDTCERVEVNGTGAYTNQTAQRWPDGDGTRWRTDVSSNWRPFGVGDLDDDDLPDFFVTGSSRSNRMIYNCGYENGLPWVDTSRVPIGQFRFNTFRALPESNEQSRAAVVADFNGDTHPDIMRCGASNMPVSLWLNDGAAKWYDVSAFAIPSDINVTCNEKSMVAVDLDNDGDLDVHIEGNNNVRAQLVNDGNGIFVNRAALNVTASVQTNSEWTMFVDLDNDGDQDWLVGWTYFGGGVRVFINGGDAFGVGGAFGIERTSTWVTAQNAIPSSDYQNTTHAAIININNDQYPDLYIGASGINRAWLNVGGERFVVAQSNAVPPGPFINQTSTSTNYVLAADFDNDGDTDVVDVLSGRNRYHLRSGASGYFDVTNDTMPNVTGTSRSGDIGDIDLDGLPDTYIANSGQDQIFLSTGNGFNDASEGLPWIPHDTYRAFLWDFDNDCDLDVLTINNQDQDRLYINTLNPSCD